MKLKDRIQKEIDKTLNKINKAKSVNAIERLRKRIEAKKNELEKLDSELKIVESLTTGKKAKGK